MIVGEPATVDLAESSLPPRPLPPLPPPLVVESSAVRDVLSSLTLMEVSSAPDPRESEVVATPVWDEAAEVIVPDAPVAVRVRRSSVVVLPARVEVRSREGLSSMLVVCLV